MARVFLNTALSAIHGRIGSVVFKTYGKKVFMTRVPSFEGYVPSAAQRAQRAAMREATAYAKRVYADPDLKAVYVAAAEISRRCPFRLAIADYLAMQRGALAEPRRPAGRSVDVARRSRLVRCGVVVPVEKPCAPQAAPRSAAATPPPAATVPASAVVKSWAGIDAPQRRAGSRARPPRRHRRIRSCTIRVSATSPPRLFGHASPGPSRRR